MRLIKPTLLVEWLHRHIRKCIGKSFAKVSNNHYSTSPPVSIFLIKERKGSWTVTWVGGTLRAGAPEWTPPRSPCLQAWGTWDRLPEAAPSGGSWEPEANPRVRRGDQVTRSRLKPGFLTPLPQPAHHLLPRRQKLPTLSLGTWSLPCPLFFPKDTCGFHQSCWDHSPEVRGRPHRGSSEQWLFPAPLLSTPCSRQKAIFLPGAFPEAKRVINCTE